MARTNFQQNIKITDLRNIFEVLAGQHFRARGATVKLYMIHKFVPGLNHITCNNSSNRNLDDVWISDLN